MYRVFFFNLWPAVTNSTLLIHATRVFPYPIRNVTVTRDSVLPIAKFCLSSYWFYKVIYLTGKLVSFYGQG
jgi:hypothetical protein